MIYTARVNQVFTSWDKLLEITYDGGSGTLANVLADMTLLIGTTAGAHDIGICRLRNRDASKFYIGEESGIKVMDNHHLTVVDDFGLWARHVVITNGVAYMDGGIAYSNQHTNFDPTPIMGSDRVLKLTGSSISTQFDFSLSYCLDSSISAYSCSAPTASSSSGMTTATPTITFDTVGWHLVYLTLTAANGKTYFGVRYVYVWNDANPPPLAQIGECVVNADTGGWEFDITLMEDCDLDAIRDHALVILFAEDYYGDTQQSIGPLAGCENVMVEGWIGKEKINWNPEQGNVRFGVFGAHYWFQKIASYPDGVEIVPDAATAWTEMKGLTVNKGVWHFLHWRTTATRVMDVFLSDSTALTKEVSSLAQNLWAQLQEMAFLQIFARPGVNRYNQLYIEVHPQLVAEADRTWPTVMDITKEDWEGEIDFDRETVEEVAQVNLSGVSVNANGIGTSYFALSTGHTYGRFGTPEIQDRLLVASQAQALQKCGLYFGWRNNEYKNIPVIFASNNRLIDCFPRQKCTITIEAGDTPRGIEYDGGLIPTSVSFVQNPETGYIHTEATFEAETFEALAIVGDAPSGADISTPPSSPLPPFIEFPEIILPGVPEARGDGPQRVIIHDVNVGLLYSDNFDETGANVKWRTINPGLQLLEYQLINTFFTTPNGALYAAYCDIANSGNYTTRPWFVARAASPGATFVKITSEAVVRPVGLGGDWQLACVGHNPLVAEQVAFIAGVLTVDKKIWVGAGASFAAGVAVDTGYVSPSGLSYGLGNWLYARLNSAIRISVSGASIVGSGTPAVDVLDLFAPILGHVPASTTGRTFHSKAGGGGYVVGDNNLNTVTSYTDASFVGTGFACDPTGMFMMTRYGVGAKGKSSDGGATFTAIGALPPGNWWWAYAGGEGANSQWIAAGGSSIRWSPDFGATAWHNKEGNLSTVVPVPNINGVKVVGV